jgi:hypothetical protein
VCDLLLRRLAALAMPGSPQREAHNTPALLNGAYCTIDGEQVLWYDAATRKARRTDGAMFDVPRGAHVEWHQPSSPQSLPQFNRAGRPLQASRPHRGVGFTAQGSTGCQTEASGASLATRFRSSGLRTASHTEVTITPPIQRDLPTPRKIFHTTPAKSKRVVTFQMAPSSSADVVEPGTFTRLMAEKNAPDFVAEIMESLPEESLSVAVAMDALILKDLTGTSGHDLVHLLIAASAYWPSDEERELWGDFWFNLNPCFKVVGKLPQHLIACLERARTTVLDNCQEDRSRREIGSHPTDLEAENEEFGDEDEDMEEQDDDPDTARQQSEVPLTQSSLEAAILAVIKKVTGPQGGLAGLAGAQAGHHAMPPPPGLYGQPAGPGVVTTPLAQLSDDTYPSCFNKYQGPKADQELLRRNWDASVKEARKGQKVRKADCDSVGQLMKNLKQTAMNAFAVGHFQMAVCPLIDPQDTGEIMALMCLHCMEQPLRHRIEPRLQKPITLKALENAAKTEMDVPVPIHQRFSEVTGTKNEGFYTGGNSRWPTFIRKWTDHWNKLENSIQWASEEAKETTKVFLLAASLPWCIHRLVIEETTKRFDGRYLYPPTFEGDRGMLNIAEEMDKRYDELQQHTKNVANSNKRPREQQSSNPQPPKDAPRGAQQGGGRGGRGKPRGRGGRNGGRPGGRHGGRYGGRDGKRQPYKEALQKDGAGKDNKRDDKSGKPGNQGFKKNGDKKA